MKQQEATKKRIPGFSDCVVIYHSQDDNCWIAHSLRTDQIGTGIDIVHAYADLIRAVDQLLQLAQEDETVAYLREAPEEIQRMAKNGKPLPLEIFEVAHKLARGVWPPNIDPAFMAQNDGETFVSEIPEPSCA